jgi:hypothetical protein
MYSMLNEEVARMARRDAERRARFNATNLALRSEAPMPGALRRATARSLLRAGLALLGERQVAAALLPLTEEECAC